MGLSCQSYMSLAQRAAPTLYLSLSEALAGFSPPTFPLPIRALAGAPGEVALRVGEDCVVTHAGQTLDTAGSQKAIGERLILESWSESV